MSWALLGLGIALEVAGTLCMKGADGFSDWRLAALMYALYGLSLTALTLAFRNVDVSLAYAVWSGGGLVLIAVAGIVWFKEPVTPPRLLFIAFVLIGLVGLNLVSHHER